MSSWTRDWTICLVATRACLHKMISNFISLKKEKTDFIPQSHKQFKRYKQANLEEAFRWGSEVRQRSEARKDMRHCQDMKKDKDTKQWWRREAVWRREVVWRRVAVWRCEAKWGRVKMRGRMKTWGRVKTRGRVKTWACTKRQLGDSARQNLRQNDLPSQFQLCFVYLLHFTIQNYLSKSLAFEKYAPLLQFITEGLSSGILKWARWVTSNPVKSNWVLQIKAPWIATVSANHSDL